MFKRKTTTIFISLSVACGPNRNINRCIFCICKILLIPAECRVQKYIKGMKVDTCLVGIEIPKDEGNSFNAVVPRIYWSVIARLNRSEGYCTDFGVYCTGFSVYCTGCSVYDISFSVY